MAAPEMSTPGTAVYRETIEALDALRHSANGKVSEASAPSWSDADVAALRKIARRHQQCTDRLHRVWGGKSKSKFEHTRTQYLGAFPTRVCATVRAFAKARPRGTLQDIYKFAKELDVWEPLSEPVLVRLQPKPKGGFRRITKDGPRRMAQRFMVRDVLTAVGVDNEHDYCRRGAGGEKALIRDACQRIKDGYRHWQTVDVKECFASLRPGHFAWLPLPKELIRDVVFLPKCAKIRVVVPGGETLPYSSTLSQTSKRSVRRELPQGSVLSPMVARAFVGRELRAALGNDEVARFSFVDDLTLGARSQPGVKQALDALRSRLLTKSAGPISLHIHPPTCTKHGRVRVFGYVLKPGRGYGSNFVHACPNPERFDRFHKKLYDRWKAAGKPNDAEALEAFVAERLAHWMPSQQAWTVVPRHSWNVALTHAYTYICEEDLEEHYVAEVTKLILITFLSIPALAMGITSHLSVQDPGSG